MAPPLSLRSSFPLQGGLLGVLVLLVPAIYLVLCFVFCLVCALVIAAVLVRQPGYSPRLSLL